MAKPRTKKAPVAKPAAQPVAPKKRLKKASPPKAVKSKRVDKRGTPKAAGTVKPKHGGRIGNPSFKATDEQRLLVEYLTACGQNHEMIAGKLQISRNTLMRHFRVELDDGAARATARLGGVLYEGALAGDPKKLEMWFDRRGGPVWQKKTGLELSGPGGQPIRHEDMSQPADFSKLPLDERRLLENLLRKAEAGQVDESP